MVYDATLTPNSLHSAIKEVLPDFKFMEAYSDEDQDFFVSEKHPTIGGVCSRTMDSKTMEIFIGEYFDTIASSFEEALAKSQPGEAKKAWVKKLIKSVRTSGTDVLMSLHALAADTTGTSIRIYLMESGTTAKTLGGYITRLQSNGQFLDLFRIELFTATGDVQAELLAKTVRELMAFHETITCTEEIKRN